MPNEVCEDCVPEVPAQKAKETQDGLQLGACAKQYRAWVDCNEEHQGQASACATEMKAFTACHRAQRAAKPPR